MKKSIGIIIALVVVVGAVLILKSINTTKPLPTNTNNNVPIVTTPTKTTKPSVVKTKPKVIGYTMSDVATHATASSCWTAVNGSLYDVTSWINKHPGGAQAILGMCGKDASGAFNNQHGGQSRPEVELASFKIGLLN